MIDDARDNEASDAKAKDVSKKDAQKDQKKGAKDEPAADSSAPPLQETAECGMCHRQVPVRQTMTLGGRVLCFGCAGGWFDEDEDEPA